MNFAFRSFDPDGRLRVGNVEAESAADALLNLTDQKLTVVELREGRQTLWARLNEPRGNEYSVGRRDVQTLLADLAQLLAAGIRVEHALRISSELATKTSVKKLALSLLDDLRKGLTLADACSNRKNVFPLHVTAALAAGERSGQIDQTLSRLTQSESQILGFRDKLISNLIYPAILLFTVGVTFAIIMFVVLPGFAPLFDLNDDRVPLVTRLVMRLGQNAGSIGIVIGSLLACLLVTITYISGNEDAKKAFDRWLAGRQFGQSWFIAPDLIRSCQILGASLQSGIKIDFALRLAAETTRNSHLRQLLFEATREVRKGQSLVDFLERQPIIPRLLIHFMRIGDQTGNMGEMALAAAQQLTQSYQKRLDRLLALFPPIITLVLGGVAAILVSAVILGMISLNNVAR